MTTIAERRARFAELHAAPGAFIMPNPWDIGGARYLESLGFRALATTSRGAAFAHGLPDGGMTREAMLAHIATIVAATELPVNADFENAFADSPEGVADSVTKCVATGVAGFSIEDYSGDAAQPFYPFDVAVERVKAARAAIDSAGEKVLLTARSEIVLHKQPGGLEEALRRLEAYATAGADVLYAPGLTTGREVAEVVRVAAGLPVNVLAMSPTFNLAQLSELGVRRISVGGSLARVAWDAFMKAAKDIAEHGRFDAFTPSPAFAGLQEFFRRPRA
jgi:2-methylisocitrate lyase-like PEP mutase family enzyme